jgi:hypothetical protein
MAEIEEQIREDQQIIKLRNKLLMVDATIDQLVYELSKRKGVEYIEQKDCQSHRVFHAAKILVVRKE